MKRQFQIQVAMIITLAVISCSKEKIEPPDAEQNNTEETATVSSSSRPNNDPLIYNLEGRFEFDGNLKEIAGRLPVGVPTTRGAAKYRKDRKGNEQKALLFDETYGVNLFNIPQQSNTSLSVWLYTGLIPDAADVYPYGKVVSGIGPTITYLFMPAYFWFPPQYYIRGGVTLSNLTSSNTEIVVSTKDWHHVVVTYDGNTIRQYLNGNLVDSESFAGVIKNSRQNYKLGFTTVDNFYWLGALDDLRFYSKTLSANDVQRLYNQ